MTEKELREIKRRFRAERSNIPRIVGCFVNQNNQIIARISQPLALAESSVSERLLGILKKTLSGGLGTNLHDIPFSMKQVTGGEEHGLLMGLLKSHLGDAELLERFYENVKETLHFDGNYVILLANDIYDVPTFGKDGEKNDTTETYSYIVCAVCPVKSMNDAISFRESDSLFHTLSLSALLASPELGFLFPTFDDRRSNIYDALYYTRSLSESYPEFTKRILASEPPMPPQTQRATFNGCLTDALSEECSLEVVRAVHAQIAEKVAEHKESRDPEPLTLSKGEVRSMLANCGVEDSKLEKLDTALTKEFGGDAEWTPKNVVSVNKFELSLPEVSIKVSPEHRDLISTQTINGSKYVMIRVTGAVEVNGIPITIDGE